MVFISNSNQMGYNFSFTPKASLTDGWLDLVVIPQLNFFEKLSLGFHIISNKIASFKKAKHILIKELSIEIPEKIFTDIQLDGEYHNVKTNKMEISVIQSGLNVIV